MKLALLKHVALPNAVLRLMLAPGANRLVVLQGGKPTLFLDATSGKEIAKLPKDSFVSAIDPAGSLATVTADGKTVKGRYEWHESLWDLARGKKSGGLATSNPDDKIEIEAIGPTRILGVRRRKTEYSACFFDHRGKLVSELSLGKVPLPFHAAMSPDETAVAHAYFTGAAHLLDVAKEKSQKLDGGTLRIGREHAKGISKLAFDASGEHVYYVSGGSQAVHVWNARTRKSLKGAWTKAPAHDAFIHEGSLVVLVSSAKGATATMHSLDGKGKARTVELGKGSTHFARVGEGPLLACAGNTEWDPSATNGLAVFDLESGKCAAKAKLPASMKLVSTVDASPGKVAVGDRKGGVAIYALR